MAFFDPVDPSTESLMWPGRVGFCLVAPAATSSAMLPLLAAGSEQKWTAAPCRSRRGASSFVVAEVSIASERAARRVGRVRRRGSEARLVSSGCSSARRSRRCRNRDCFAPASLAFRCPCRGGRSALAATGVPASARLDQVGLTGGGAHNGGVCAIRATQERGNVRARVGPT